MAVFRRFCRIICGAVFALCVVLYSALGYDQFQYEDNCQEWDPALGMYVNVPCSGGGGGGAVTTSTVTLDGNGGTVPSAGTTITATYGLAMPTITSDKLPTRTGYTFIGYYDATTLGTQYYNASGTSVKTWDKTGAQTLYAHWTPNIYQITFNKNANDATLSGTSPLYVKYNSANVFTSLSGSTIGTVPTATQSGYAFNGWYTAASGGSQVYDAQGVLQKNVSGYTSNENSPKWITTTAQTLYAQWTEDTSSSCPSGQISETGSITIVGYLSDNFCSQNELGQESASDIMSDFYRRGYQGACGIEGQDTHFFETYCSNNNHHAKWFAQDNNGIILFGESTCIDHANTTESGIDTNLVTQNNLLTGSDCWCRIAGFGDGEGGSIPFSPESSWYYQQLIDPYSLYSAEEKSKPTTDLSRCAMLCSNACASQVVQSFSANNRYSNTTQSSAFYNSVTGSAQICRSPVFNVVYNGGGNTGGSAPSKPTSCTYGGTCNAPSNRYIKTGYTFNGWACTSSSGSCAQATYAAGESIANATSVDGATITLTAQWIQTPISCSQNQILTEDGCQDAEFIVTTTSDTGASFSFRIAAAGRFYVDCVGGTSLSGNGVIAGTNIIDRANNVTEALYTCNWASSGEHVIRFGGHADGYNDNYYYSAIKFPFTDGIHGYRIRKISGSLGHIFGTVENPTIGVGQPCFYATFKDQSMMEGTDINDPNNTDPNTNLPMKYALPPNLFDGVSGEPREGIFFNTFNGCSGMTGSIPPRLFGDLNGEYKREIFDNTFYGCSGLTGPFPSTLFSGLYGDLAQGTFGNTFNGCSGLTGAISSNMFGRYSGQPAANMFSWTFYGCSGLNGIKTGNVTTGYIPESFLRDIVDSQLQYQANGMFTGTGLGPCPTGYVDVTRAQFSDAGKPWCALGKYAITFNANNGTLSGTNPLYTKYNDSDIYADAEATSTGSLPTITRTGYTFNGWYTAASGGSQVYNASGVLQRNVSGYTSDESTPKWITTTAQTLYAQWTPNTYGITYDKQGGQVYGSFVSQHTPGTTTVLGSNTGSKTGYRFDYWCVDSTACTSGTTIIRADQVPANGNTFTLYAVWVPETYAITFNANEGTLSGTNPLYAKYNDANIYTTSSATTTGSLPTVTRTEYIFNGWYTAASGGSQVYNASGVLQKNVTGYTSNENSPKWITTSPQTLYAQWTANTYAITFDKNANDAALSGTNPLYAKYNDANIYTTSSATTTGSLPTVTRTGYIFNGWYTAASGGSQVYNSSGVLQKNVTGYTSNENSPKWTTTSTQTLYAQWAQNAYTITYNLDGGSGCSDTTYSGTTTLCEPTRTGYSFDGWATSAGGAVAYASGSSVTNVDLTLYAKWTPNTYAITFNANEGTLSGTNPLYAKYNDASIYTTAAATTTGTLPTATRNGYTFNGWYTASSDGSQVYNASGVLQKNISGYTSNDDAPKWITTSTQTLYAQWTSNSCTVTFKTGDATMGTQNFTFGTAQALTGVSSLNNTPVNSATGWLFYGWTTNTNTSTRIYTDGQSISDLCADGNNVTLYGIWKRDASFTYYANAGSTTPTTSQQTQYYYNTDTSTANTTSVNVPTLYDQTTYGWNAFGWWGSPSVPTSDSDITINKTEISINPGINNNYDFYAIYKRPVSLTYNTNGGSGTMANTTDYQYFSAALPTAGTLSLTLSNNGFTAPNGYSFDKWAAGSVSGDQYSEDASFDFPNRSWTSSDSYNMYAIWSANTIVFNWQNGGRGTAPTTPASCAYGESFDMPAAMTYAGYTFDKWNTNGNTNTQFNAGATVSCTYDNLGVYGGQTTITGSWTSNIYNVAYNCGAGARGNAPAGTTVTFDTLFQVADNNTCAKDGYVFDGWTVSGTNDVKHANDEFIWNYAEDKTFTVKWKLAFCPKNQYLENDSCKICSVETNGVYPYSEARSTSIDDCYTPCTSENANIDNATEFSGLVYHDGKKTCQPVSCVLGYHVDTVNPVLNTIVGTNSVNGSVAQINVTGNFSETGASKGQAYYGITANNSFAVDYLHKGVLTGQAVCSSHIGTNNNYSWSDPTIVRDSSTLSTTGGNCYCKSEKWKAEGEEEFKDLTSYWVFQLDAGNNCGATCASECASAMLYTTAFRSVAFDMLDSFGSRCDFNNYNVTYNCGEGSGTPQPLTAKATYTKSFTPAANTCTKQGYEFKGWLVSNTNDHIKQAGESFAWNYTENKTFTAQWGSKTYTVEYNCGTGSGTKPADETAIFDEAFAPAVNTCSNAGYDFDGWLVSNTNNHKKYENIQFVWDYEENKTFTAQWVPHTYTITYDLNDISNTVNPVHSGVKPTEYTIETETFTVSDPTMTGYTFTGWTVETTIPSAWGSGSSTASTTVPVKNFVVATGTYGNITFRANWVPETYTITYDLNDISDSVNPVNDNANPTEYTMETETFTLNNPEMPGYTFNGWTVSVNPTEWGNGSSQVLIPYEDYEPVASFTVATGTYGNITFKANWTANRYSVSYKCGNGSGSEASGTAIYDSEFITGNNRYCSKEGYTFAGWLISGTDNVIKQPNDEFVWIYTSNKTFTAQWEPNSYTVTYECGNNVTGDVPGVATVSYNTNYTPAENTCVKNNNVFVGWIVSNTGNGFNDRKLPGETFKWEYTENKTFTAEWMPIYEVTLNKDGGTGGLSMIYVYNGRPYDSTDFNTDTHLLWNRYDAAIETSEKEGYDFVGYYLNNLKMVNDDGTDYAANQRASQISANETWTAHWTPKIYSVTYSCGEGTGTPPGKNNNVVYNTQFVTSGINKCTKTGHDFSGWLISDTDVIKQPGDTFAWNYVSNKTFTAQWEPKTYPITYKSDNTVLSSIDIVPREYVYGVGVNQIAQPEPTKEGYTFNGWCKNVASCDNSSKTIVVEITDIEEQIFNADWTPKAYHIYYYCDENSEVVRDDQVHFQERYRFVSNTSNNTICSKTGYTFTGWNCSYLDDPETSIAPDYITSWQIAHDIKCIPNEWQENEYIITFDANSRDVQNYNAMPNMTCKYTGCTLNPNLYINSGADFDGWKTADDTFYADQATVTGLTSNITLLAQWGKKCIVCEPGYYLEMNKIDTCTICPQGSFCTGSANETNGRFCYEKYTTQGRKTCPSSHPNTDGEGTPARTQCYTSCEESFENYVLDDGSDKVYYPNTKAEQCKYVAHIVYGGDTGCENNKYYSTDNNVDLCVPAAVTGKTFVGWTGNNGVRYNVENNPDLSDIETATFSPVDGYVNMTPNWNIEKHTISYDCQLEDSDKIILMEDLEYDSDIELLNYAECNNPGHTFNQWICDYEFVNNKMPNFDVECVADVRTNTYNIEFNGNGATSGSTGSMELEYGETSSLSPNGFTKTNYSFVYWCDKLDYNNNNVCIGRTYSDEESVNNLTAGEETITLYAMWQPHTYTISYVIPYGIKVSNPETYNIETPTFTLNNPNKPGYEFIAWCTNEDMTENCSATKTIEQGTRGNLTFFANMTSVVYPIEYKYKDKNGETKDVPGIPEGKKGHTVTEEVVYPTGIEIVGYKPINKWYTSESFAYETSRLPANNNVTWEVTVWANPEQITCNKDEYMVSEGECEACPAHTHSNGGTVDRCDCDEGYELSNGACVLHRYSITYKDGEETLTGIEPSDYSIEESVTLLDEIDIEKEGKEFRGWRDERGVLATGIEVGSTGDREFRVIWGPKTYGIMYKDGEEEITGMTPTSYTYGTATSTVAMPIPTKEGYEFIGWCKNSNSCLEPMNRIEISATDTGTQTFYAQFVTDEYNITYVLCANGDSRCNQNAYNDPANPIKYTIDTDVVLQPATRTGYDFTSWIDVRGNSFAEIVGTRMSGNKKLYAQWTPKIIHCEPGEFLPAYSEQCVQCDEENIYCPGGDYVYSDKPDGKKDCPSNYPFAERGSVSINQCFGQCPDDGVGNVHANGEKSCRYSINYVLNGGEFNTEYPTYYDSGAGVLELVSPVKDNYRFVGWYTDSGMRGSPIEYINTNGYGHVTLYAKWQFYCESGKWLHVGHKETDKICLYSEDNKPALPTMVFDTSDGPHYIMLTDDANTHMHEGSNRKFRLKIGNRVYNAYDASVITY